MVGRGARARSPAAPKTRFGRRRPRGFSGPPLRGKRGGGEARARNPRKRQRRPFEAQSSGLGRARATRRGLSAGSAADCSDEGRPIRALSAFFLAARVCASWRGSLCPASPPMRWCRRRAPSGTPLASFHAAFFFGAAVVAKIFSDGFPSAHGPLPDSPSTGPTWHRRGKSPFLDSGWFVRSYLVHAGCRSYEGTRQWPLLLRRAAAERVASPTAAGLQLYGFLASRLSCQHSSSSLLQC